MTDFQPLSPRRYAGLAAGEMGAPDGRPPLVLLHGLTFDRRMWRPALTELGALDPGRHALVLDLPGHGESPDARSYSLQAVVARVQAAIVEAGLEKPVLVGHSASAATVAVYASQHPTSGLVEVEGTFEVAPFAEMVRSLEPALRGPGFADVWARIAANAFRLDEVSVDVRAFVEATSVARQEVVLGYWQDLLEESSERLAARIAGVASQIRRSGVPVTSVVGQASSPTEQAWIRANLPAMQTLVWPGSGHFPHLAHPRQFAELLAATGNWVETPAVASAGR